MSIYSIADLHLSITVDKPMDKFGCRWTDYMRKIEKNWRAVVTDDDTVIIPGDISWGISLEEALEDLKFLDGLPGKKLLGRGNHDYWWATVTKMKAFLAKHQICTIDFLYNNAVEIEDYVIAGTRGWYVEEHMQVKERNADYDTIVNRENIRLEMSLKEAAKLREETGKEILAYFHFPPFFGDFRCGEFIETLAKYGVKHCYFGHIHGNYGIPRTVNCDGIDFTIVSADYLNFIPMITCPFDE